MDKRKLSRSRDDAMIAGVCGGLGRYFGLDSTFVRIFFALLALTGNGIGVLIYILLWIVMPHEDIRSATLGETARAGADEIAAHARNMGDELRSAIHNPHPQTTLYVGIALIFLGLLTLVQNLHIPWLRWLQSDVLLPMLLILAGLFLLLRRWRGE